MLLTPDQIRLFRHQGYFRLAAALGAAEVARLRAVLDDHVARAVEPVQYDPQGRVNRLDRVVRRDAAVLEAVRSPAVLDPLISLLGPNVELTLNRHNHATMNLRGSNRFRLHRDVLQWSRPVVTAVIYLEEATTETGCTYLVPGSQFLPYVGTPNNGGTWMDEHSVYAGLIDQAVPIPVPRGGVLYFDSLAFHTVGENTTDRPRVSLAFGFRSADELCAATSDVECLLVCGERLYRGNDRPTPPAGSPRG